MDDEMDVYLSRSLKNWAVRQKPEPDGRDRLLQTVGQSRGHSVSTGKAPAQAYLPRYHKFDWDLVPFTQSRTWSLHLATTLRMVS